MLSFIGLGLLAGVLSGIFGIGGGVVLVPALLIFGNLEIKQAIGVSLAVIVPTALSGAVKHYHAGNIDLELSLLIAVGGVLGGLLGASLAEYLPAATLKKIYGVFLVLVGLNIVFDWTSGISQRAASKNSPSSETTTG